MTRDTGPGAGSPGDAARPTDATRPAVPASPADPARAVDTARPLGGAPHVDGTRHVDPVDPARGAARPVGRTLVTGWFSFLHGEATAGDVLALRRVRTVLDGSGVPYDVAWSPGFRPGRLSLEAARPADYRSLVFVCGPLHGPLVAGLHDRFAHCWRVAVGVSVVDENDPAVAGFDVVVPRDVGDAGGTGAGPRGAPVRPAPDLALRAPEEAAPPVVGVVLTAGQHEYGSRRLHAEVARRISEWLADTDCAPLPLETRLDASDGLLCATGGQFLAVLSRTDVVVTDRLHGLVLALRLGVPVIAVDPVRGGAKLTAQARACRWPALVPGEALTARALDAWWVWCVGDRGRAAARRRRRVLAVTPDPADALRAALTTPRTERTRAERTRAERTRAAGTGSGQGWRRGLTREDPSDTA